MSAIAPPPPLQREAPPDTSSTPPGKRPTRRTPGRLRRVLRGRAAWFVALPLGFVLGLVASGLAYITTLNANTPPALSFGDAPVATAPVVTAPVVNTPVVTPEAGDTGTTDEATAEIADADAAADTTAGEPAAEPEDPGGDAGTTTAPQPDDSAASAPAPAEEPAPQGSPLDGTWVIGSGTQAGYRVDYSAVGMSGTRVGRGTAVTGQFELQDAVVLGGAFAVDFRQVYCDAGEQCDEHVREIMAVEEFPYEEFRLTQPIDMGEIPAEGEPVTATAVGELTLRGVTNPVTFEVSARRNAGRVEVLGSILINRDDYNIPDSDEPGFSIDKEGLIEFLLAFDHQG